MNEVARVDRSIVSEVIGGNLTLISRTFSLGHLGLAIDINQKILVIEDEGEPFRKIDGILQQMQLRGYFVEQSHKPLMDKLG